MNKYVKRTLWQGAHPLLSESQLQCFEDISSVVEDEYYNPACSKIRDMDEEGALSVAMEISKTQEMMKNIIANLERSPLARDRFCSIYPKWKKTREETIRKLQKLAESINADRGKYNWWKLAGYGTSFLGGGIGLASILSIPLTGGLSTPLVVAGGAFTTTGVVGLIGTSVFEYKSLNDYVKESQDIVKKDKKYLDDMRDWLKIANELEKALSEVLEIDLAKEIFESVKNLAEEALKISSYIERVSFIKEQLKEIIKKLPKHYQTSVKTLLVSTIIQALVLVCLLNIDNRFVFDYSTLTIRSFAAIFSFLDDAIDVVRLAEAFGDSVVRKGLQNTVMRSAFAAFGMALDVAGIIVTSNDIYSGSTSPFANKISDAAKELKKEAEVLAKVYGEIDD